jgi:hypothetical protein
VHPACFSGAASTDFSLFASLKGEIGGFTENSSTDILSEIRWIFQEVSKETLVDAYDEWITKHKGGYYHRE